ncbi:hypothetical protein COY07_06305 [Candidatus Peregrinibacteria bacterium CG_4_10_14_0_2_um_filter_43_11]|nr:MAG: hypothetical protein COY07_06305 [Candidatus Peregrinibacteria bacterium CG_4_10_14_0_2_um_filter_43_11]
MDDGIAEMAGALDEAGVDPARVFEVAEAVEDKDLARLLLASRYVVDAIQNSGSDDENREGDQSEIPAQNGYFHFGPASALIDQVASDAQSDEDATAGILGYGLGLILRGSEAAQRHNTAVVERSRDECLALLAAGPVFVPHRCGAFLPKTDGDDEDGGELLAGE